MSETSIFMIRRDITPGLYASWKVVKPGVDFSRGIIYNLTPANGII